VERKQIEHKAEADHKFEQIFNAIEAKSIKPKQGIFFDGQIYDAYKFVSDLIRSARKSIIVIDNYVDDAVLTLLSKSGKKVKITILTKNHFHTACAGCEKIQRNNIRQSRSKNFIILTTDL